MKKTILLFLLGACVATPTTNTSAQRTVIDTPCASNADCPAGFECEIEHGTSFCQSDDPADDGSDDNGMDAGSDDNGSGSGSDDGSGSGSGSDDSGHHGIDG
jgi:Cys-rich repeat protein